MTIDEKVATFLALGDEIIDGCGKKGIFTVMAIKDKGYRVYIEIFGGRKGGFALDRRATLKDFEHKFVTTITSLTK